MEDVKTGEAAPRTLDGVQVDYNRAAAKLGDLEFRSKLMESDKNRVLKEMDDLQLEARALKEAADASA